MKLTELLRDIEYEVINGDPEKTEIGSVIYDSRKAEKDCLFVCITGANSDGHSFAAEVIEKGAAALITEKEVLTASSHDTVVIRVKNTRYALALLSAAWFKHPADSLKVIGVTGTKGKTTTTYLTKAILENAGHKVGLIGTIETVAGDRHIPSKNTTPESYVLQETFREMADQGIDTVVMEVSSQALMMDRTAGFTFDTAVFTNIEPDHIGPNEHKDFDDYLYCKSLLFKQCRYAVVNGDDSHLSRIIENIGCDFMTFGLKKDNTIGSANDLRALNEKLIKVPGELGVSFDIEGEFSLKNVEVGTPGDFSVYNALCATAVAIHYGAGEDAVRAALKSARVRGRIEAVNVSDKFSLIIDYAHNAMALESLLISLKKYEPARLICLFGCGGNRARSRRFEMGEVSGKYADLTIITSDNPRFEEPSAIIDDIETGIKKTGGRYIRIEDRKEAIAWAIRNGESGDLVILAGKGHEDYQEIKGVKHPMDERVLINEILGRKVV
ncbi:MAG: UDP-N-acetylmuramoyl-L-alanyl-D-glutamate--2,6-diaminopimelate ligase [Lachnospiraceae bacterium]|nr:UDP-N-acetylmuramoyl-L-alanyl-D-glutamate--2,6-diaminopimelate ligase [Lachnospiraceae bacterium]